MLSDAGALRGLRPPTQPQPQDTTLGAPMRRPPARTNSAKCNPWVRAAGDARGNLRKGRGGGPGARWRATWLTRTGVAAQTSLSSQLGADISWPSEARAAGSRTGSTRTGSPRPGSPWAVVMGAPSHFGGCGPGDAGLGTDGVSRGLLRRQETPAPAPRPGTHAGFMAAGSALPRRASGTPDSVGRAGEDGGPQEPAAGTGARQLRRGAQKSLEKQLRDQVSSRPAHFKRANQCPPAGKGRGLRKRLRLPERRSSPRRPTQKGQGLSACLGFRAGGGSGAQILENTTP